MESAIDNHDQVGRIDYSKNPRMLYGLMCELKEEIAPLFIQPLIMQGIYLHCYWNYYDSRRKTRMETDRE